MAHDLYIKNDQAAMMYVGNAPWHGLGTRLEQPATSAQAIQAAKLDWQVSKKLLYPLQNKQGGAIQESYAVVREDSNCVLGFVGPKYTPLQNREAFGFFDSIVGSGAAIYHTAGALGKGERVWIMAKLPGDMRVVGDDILHKYLLLSNSHDGRSTVEIKFTPVRVVCQNTLMLALSVGSTLCIPHSEDIGERLVDTAALLRGIHLRFEDMENTFKAMSVRQVGKKDVHVYLNNVFPDPLRLNNDELYERMRAQAQIDRLVAERLFDQGKGNSSGPAKGTLWAAYNGVTEYLDHRRYNHLPMERRWQQLWFGLGCLEKQCAYRIARDVVHRRFQSSYLDSDARRRILAQLQRSQERLLVDKEYSAIRRALHALGADHRVLTKSARSHSVGPRDLRRVREAEYKCG
jgi:phage/plasmid-like protein (TIGR03299 family)